MKKLPLRPQRAMGWIAGAIAISSANLSCSTEPADLSNRELTEPSQVDASSNVISVETEQAPAAIAPESSLQTPAIATDDIMAEMGETQSGEGESADSTAADELEPNASSLIQPTNLPGHTAQIRSGRSDPFAPLDSQAIVISSRPPAPPAPAAPLPVPQAISTVPVQAAPLPPVAVDENPAIADDPVAVAPAPSSRLADTIEIMGVVDAGGQISIILRVPNERTSRYVRVGEYLANGQVLVKRVDMQSGGEPIVILEQDGMEIPRYVSGATLG